MLNCRGVAAAAKGEAKQLAACYCLQTVTLDGMAHAIYSNDLTKPYAVQVGPSSLREATGAMRSLVGEALLQLIQRPSAIAPSDCPETLLLDLQRLVAAQNELQRLSLVGASLLVAQMLLGAKGLPSSPLTAENRRWPQPPINASSAASHIRERAFECSACLLQQSNRIRCLIACCPGLRTPSCTHSMSGLLSRPHRTQLLPCRYYADVKETFAALLAQPDVRMPHLSAAMAEALAKRAAGGDAPAQPSAEDRASVERLLHRIFSVDDIIYKKVCKNL